MLPGVFAGIAHAVLFPSVTAQGSHAFPNRYRGLGTTVMLAMLDLGALVGAPLIAACRVQQVARLAALPNDVPRAGHRHLSDRSFLCGVGSPLAIQNFSLLLRT